MTNTPLINGTDTLKDAYPKFNEAITKSNMVQSQLDQIVVEGSIDPETAQARVKADGTSYPVLRDRLNNVDELLADNAIDFTNRGVSVKKNGAIGDGDSHPLSIVFPTLVLAQMKYPHATSLTQEIDWAAIQGAINSVSRGLIIIPPGDYIVEKISLNAKKNIKIEGYGANLLSMNASVDILLSLSDVENISVNGLRFDYRNQLTNYSSTSGLMIKLDNYRAVYIRDCEFINIASHAIYADNAKDDNGAVAGTTSTNLTIKDCIFKEQTQLNTINKQSAIYLGADGEYVNIINNEFRKCYAAIIGMGGANALVDGNTAMSSKLSWFVDSAIFYFASPVNVNSAKVIITNNRLNHNDFGTDIIKCVGNPARNERRFTISNNHLLINGNALNSQGIILLDADYSAVIGNYIVTNPNALSDQACVTLDSSDMVIVDNNTFQYSSGVKLINNSKSIIGRNTLQSPVTNAKNTVSQTGSQIIPASGISNFRIKDTDGTWGGESDNSTWICVRNSIGDYTFTHNLGHTYYSVTCVADNTTTACVFAVTRTINTVNIKCYGLNSALRDANILGMLKVTTTEQ